MSDVSDFVSIIAGQVERWHGVTAPGPVALEMMADLQVLIADLERLRGELRFEDEPSSFEAALLEAAAETSR